MPTRTTWGPCPTSCATSTCPSTAPGCRWPCSRPSSRSTSSTRRWSRGGPASAPPGPRPTAGPFDLEFYAMSHSIPDGMAVALRTPGGTIVHTGDWKMDLTPIDGRPTDLGGLARLAGEGIDLLLSDSTNAEQPGFIVSEVEVGRALEDIFEAARRRIVVACFASHVRRVQQILGAAARLRRTGPLAR